MVKKRKKISPEIKKEFRKQIQPTYTGKNPNCQFNGNPDLFILTPQPGEVLDRVTAKLFSRSVRNTFKTWDFSRDSKYGSINKTKTNTTPEFWLKFEQIATKRGVDLINYLPVMKEYVFNGLEVYGKNAVILGQEMQWESIKTANSMIASTESMRMQDVLGATTLFMCEYLQEQGYKAEAHVPFGGKLLVPPLIIAANLAIKGQDGITITPEFGPRQRWGIITTDADIPKTKKRDLSELKEFCDNCGLCIEDCLGKAVFKEPIKKEGGILTHIDAKKCLETLRNTSYCSVCLKVCPPGRIPKSEKFTKLMESVKLI
ncbi:MAG: hypothetical protein GY870_01920 [archaeon]|nr:hypothetical protein [archaeon]